jgi:type III pantothenate kinase
MFIAIDIGNTHTVLGVYTEQILIASIRISSTSRLTQKLLTKKIQSFFVKERIDTKRIDGVGISSVVPKLTNIYVVLAKIYFRHTPFMVRGDLNLGIAIHYDHPKSVGADRICTAIAGYVKYGGPLIIIDFGTATTYDVVSSNGDFLGGVIAPGIATSASALHRHTAQLAKVDLHLPNTIIGLNTRNSIQTGVLWSAIDAMTGMIDRIQRELQQTETKKALVIATGGFSRFIAEHSKEIQYVEPFLVLDGIRLIFDRIHRKRKKPI